MDGQDLTILTVRKRPVTRTIPSVPKGALVAMRGKLTIAVGIIVAICVGSGLFAASTEPTAVTSPTVTPADLGITPDGTAPMLLTNAAGEPLSDSMQVVTDGMNEKFRVAEDATNVSITEHSVAYNTGALQSAGVQPTGQPDIQWTLTNQDTGATADAGSGSTNYSGVIKAPGHYNLGNSGMTPVDTVIATGSYGTTPGTTPETVPGTIQSGTDVELEVTDITSPALKVVAVPEDHHESNECFIREDPDNLDAYPITAKTAKITCSGRNWTLAGAADHQTAAATQVDFTAPFGMVDPAEAADVADSKKNPDIKAKNDYTMDSSLNGGLAEGLYIPVSVRTNFAVSLPDDNDPRASYRDAGTSTWSLVVDDDGAVEEFREPPSFIFRKPNVPTGPSYTLVAQATDGSGNAIVCRVPIKVLPKRLDVTDLERDSQKR